MLKMHSTWNTSAKTVQLHGGSGRWSRVTSCVGSSSFLSTALLVLEVVFPQHYWRAIIFPSLAQHSIRLHVRWLWLMVVILFGHNVALLGNWRWEQGWEIVIFILYVLKEDWASVLFSRHIFTACLHSLYSHLAVSQSYFLWQVYLNLYASCQSLTICLTLFHHIELHIDLLNSNQRYIEASLCSYSHIHSVTAGRQLNFSVTRQSLASVW